MDEETSYIVLFTVGVVNVVLTGFFAAGIPFIMPYYYSVKYVVMMVYRLKTYWTSNDQLYLLDFCYFANLALILYLFVWPDNPHLFQICYAVANGPLLWAIFTFRNSLVFHSIDKVTSSLVHVTPCIITWILRWRRPDCLSWPTWITWTICKQGGELPADPCGLGYRYAGELLPFSFTELMGDETCPIWFYDLFTWPLLFYLTWFLIYGIVMITFLYQLVTETTPEGHSVYGTAYSYLTNDKSGHMRSVVKILGNSGPARLFMYVLINTSFIAFSLLLPMFFWSNFWLHTSAIVFAITACIYNGATFYVKVFSQGKDFPLLMKKLNMVGVVNEPAEPIELI